MSEARDEQLRRALLAMRRLRREVESLEAARNEPLAILGMGCRLPGGVDTPQALRRLLREGLDAVTEIPGDRWDVDALHDPDPDAPGKSYARHGGFLEGVDRFDAPFFGISPVEAESMDPQQRLLLEVSWEALEDAGQVPERLTGSRTGVFMGLCTNDYAQAQMRDGTLEDIGPFSGTGSSHSIAVGRIAHLLGLQGPAMAVDTACSSSLLALHLAAQSLRRGEVDLALAGGVNLILTPEGHVYFSRVRALAPDGRCKTFDAGADGYVRGEGCGVVVLKRLSDALSDGDDVLAVVRATAANHDGPASALTVPNGRAQVQVIREALEQAGLAPGTIDVVEAHGTGTELGDPIELEALAKALELDTGRRPLRLGSIKTNIGHLEAAAGIAGLMKLVLMLHHGETYPHLHFERLNPLVSAPQGCFEIPRALEPWPDGAAPRRGAVSAFGLSGTNVHAILEQGPSPTAPAVADDGGVDLMTLSARSEAALVALAGRMARYVAGDPAARPAICRASRIRRGHHRFRVALVNTDRAGLLAQLEALARGETPEGVWRGQVRGGEPELAFVFPPAPDGVTGSLRWPWPASGDEADPGSPDAGVPARLGDGVLTPLSLARRLAGAGVVPRVMLGAGTGVLCAAVAGDALTLAQAAALMSTEDTADAPRVAPVADTGVAVLDARGDAYSGRVPPGETPPLSPHSLTVLEERGIGIAVVLGTWPSQPPAPAGIAVLACPWTQGEDAVAGLLAALYVRGALRDLRSLDGGGGAVARLPTYAFQRRAFWFRQTPRTPTSETGSAVTRALESNDWSTLLGPVLDEAAIPSDRVDPVKRALAALSRRHREALSRMDLGAAVFEPYWIPVHGSPDQGPSRWLLLGDGDGVAAALAAGLREAGHAVRILAAPGAASLADALSADPGSSLPLAVVDLRPLDAARAVMDHGVQAAACAEVLDLLRALQPVPGRRRLWLLTRGAQAPELGQAPSPGAAALWGLGRVAALEHPDLWGGLIDLDPGRETIPQLPALVERLCAEDGEDQVALREGGARVLRLRRATLPSDSAAPLTGAWLISGGLGALGLAVAGWLVKRGVRKLVLLGRRPPADAAAAAIQALRSTGAEVVVEPGDVADARDVRRIVDAHTAAEGAPALSGVVHAAGVLDDGALQGLTLERVAAVLAPKVDGAWNLHHATLELSLDHFVLFSSLAAITGSPGQGSYAAANAALDALAWHRRAKARPALAIDWGPWGIGMAAASGRTPAAGLEPWQPEAGLALLGRLMGQGRPQLLAARVDWARLTARLGTRRLPMLDALCPGRDGRGSGPPALDAGALHALSHSGRVAAFQDYLGAQLAEALYLSQGDIGPDTDVIDLGIDSIMVVALLNRLRADLGMTVYPREVFERPRLGELSEHLARAFGEPGSSGQGNGDDDGAMLLPRLPEVGAAMPVARRNPPAVFILSSPRAGSTLLRVMLAGHPALFCPPELHLLPFQDLSARSAALAGTWLDEGLQRALMTLRGCDASASASEIATLQDSGTSVQEVYALLQRLAAPALLVDKSPSHGADPAVLQRAEQLFEGARYVHLVRDPAAVIDSFARHRMHELIGAGDADPHRLGETVWRETNANIATFLEGIDPRRQHRLHYEDLVREPAASMRSLCGFLEVAFDECVLEPYEGDRMTGGVHPESMPLGDPGFLDHDGIDRSLADAGLRARLPRPLADGTARLARTYGYAVATAAARPAATPPAAPMREWQVEARGVGLCVCEWGPAGAPAVLCVHGMLDQGAAWQPVARALVARGMRVVAPDLRGHGRSQHQGPDAGYQLLDLVADLDAVVDAMGEAPEVIVGHSLGAAVAGAYGLARGARLRALVLVEAVALDGGGAAGTLAGHLSGLLDDLVAPAEHRTLRDLDAAVAAMRTAIPALAEAEARRLAGRCTEAVDGGLRWRWDARLARRGVARLALAAMPPSALHEALVGSDLRVTLVEARREGGEAHRIPGHWTRLSLPGGHHLHIEAPEALAAVIAEACGPGIGETGAA